ncbi:MAG: hypothetical protein ACYST5_06590 [Planctomycetota bacterium]
MSKTYRPWNPHQQWLLSPPVHQWLGANDLPYFLLSRNSSQQVVVKLTHTELCYQRLS